MSKKREQYISFDIEANGPYPGDYSMLSLGAVAFDTDVEGKYVEKGTFELGFEPLPGAQEHPKTMAWWKNQPKAWEALEALPKKPALEATRDFLSWCQSFEAPPILVAWPAGFDFSFLHYYVQKFKDPEALCPISWSCIDLKSVWFGMNRKITYKRSSKKHMPSHWHGKGFPHTHCALDDAREQAHIASQMFFDR